MADRLAAIEVFVSAIRHGGLSAAARSMQMSPAMATKHLNALEARLGATLVNRTTRRLSLTEAGVDFLDRAERIMADLKEAEAQASARSVKVEGLLRVSAPASFGIHHIAHLVPQFHELHPDVTIELGLTDRYVDLAEENWHVAIRIGVLTDSSLTARKLAPMHLTICAAPDYLEKHGRPTCVADLAGHNCLGFTLVSRTGTAFWAFGADGMQHVPIKGTFHADNGEALIRAAIAGLGLVYGPRFIAEEALSSGALVEVSLDRPLMDLGAVYAVTHPTRRPAAKTRAWIDFLTQRLPLVAGGW